MTLGYKAKVHYAAIKGWENSGYVPSNGRRVKQLCETLECKVSDIFPEATIQMMKEFYGIEVP